MSRYIVTLVGHVLLITCDQKLVDFQQSLSKTCLKCLCVAQSHCQYVICFIDLIKNVFHNIYCSYDCGAMLKYTINNEYIVSFDSYTFIVSILGLKKYLVIESILFENVYTVFLICCYMLPNEYLQ